MGVHTVYSDNLRVIYKSRLCSKATYFAVVTVIFTILTPLIIAYRTEGFWQKFQVLHQQPYITFTKQYFFLAETSKGDVILCSSFEKTESVLSELSTCSTLSFYEIDHDADGKTDKWNFHIEFESPKDTTLQYLTLILLFDVKFFSECQLKLEGLAVWNQVAPPFTIKGGTFTSRASLVITQDKVITCQTNLYRTSNATYKNRVSISSILSKSSETFNTEKILKHYYEEDLTTTLSNVQNTWSSGLSSQWHINIDLKVPESQIRVRSSFVAMIKFAWMQYLAILIVIYWFVDCCKRYIFSKQILMTWNLTPDKKYL